MCGSGNMRVDHAARNDRVASVASRSGFRDFLLRLVTRFGVSFYLILVGDPSSDA